VKPKSSHSFSFKYVFDPQCVVVISHNWITSWLWFADSFWRDRKERYWRNA